VYTLLPTDLLLALLLCCQGKSPLTLYFSCPALLLSFEPLSLGAFFRKPLGLSFLSLNPLPFAAIYSLLQSLVFGGMNGTMCFG
jgi:hypothetical protein